MKLWQFIFTLCNIISFTLISYQIFIGFIIGVIGALIGIYIFKKDFWLIITQVFYLIINFSGIIVNFI
jgi:hypothetical protein